MDRRSQIMTGLLFAAIPLIFGGLSALAEEPTKIDPKAEEVMRQVSEYFSGLNSFSVDVAVTMKVQARGMKQEMTSEYTVAMRRPNLLAIVLKSGIMGATMVCDGESVHSYLPMMKKYTVTEAPATLEALFRDPSTALTNMGMLRMLFVDTLMRDDPYAVMMEGVTSGRHVGTDHIASAEAHHLKFIQQEMDWEIWLKADGAPLVQKLLPDLSKSLGGAAQRNAAMEDMKMEMHVDFKNWKVNTDLPDETFAFAPPPGAQRVDSFFEAAGMEETSPLLGRPAPEFSLPLLDGGQVKLAAHKGENIVILDFWATWCGPCRRALPLLVDVSESYKDKGVVFYGVNQRENPDTIREFLRKEGLEFTVALDADGKVGDLYGVEGIPQTVIVGKNGTVQAVHVGFHPNLKKRLKDELDALLAGKQLTAEAETDREEQKADLSAAKGLEPAWSVEGGWTGVASDDHSGSVYAVSVDGSCVELDASGEKKKEFRMKGPATTVRAANLAGDAGAELLAYMDWGTSLQAYDAEGNELWAYPGGQGVNDVCACDLNGDGLDEVIVGYNGMTGLHALDHAGNPIWTYTGIGNVWHVAAGDVSGDGKPNVVTTSAMGQVHVFDGGGKKVKDLAPGFYASMVRVARLSTEDKAATILAAGKDGDDAGLAAIDYQGTEKWSIKLPIAGTNFIDSAEVASERPWLAVALRGGQVHVIDLISGRIIGHVSGQGQRCQVGWLADKDGDSPLLLVATGRSLNAFRVPAE